MESWCLSEIQNYTRQFGESMSYGSDVEICINDEIGHWLKLADLLSSSLVAGVTHQMCEDGGSPAHRSSFASQLHLHIYFADYNEPDEDVTDTTKTTTFTQS